MAAAVKFTPTIEDHVAAQRLWLASYWRRPRMRVLAGLCALIFIIASGLALYGVIVEHRPLAVVAGELAWPLAAPFVFAGFQLAVWALIPHSVRRMSRQNPALLSASEWQWDDDGLVATSQAGSAIVRWPTLHRAMDGKASLILMPSERMLLILPLRATSTGEAADLRDTLVRFARPGSTT